MARVKLSETHKIAQRKADAKRKTTANPDQEKGDQTNDNDTVEKNKSEVKKKKRKYKNAWLRAVRKQQGVASTKFAVPRAALIRVIREIGEGKRWTPEALAAVQTAAEQYLVDAYGRANTYAVHSKRQMMTARDVKQAVFDMRKEDNRIASYALN